MHTQIYRSRYAIIIVLFIAFALRLYGINWDQGHSLHPDERMIAMVTIPLSLDNLNPEFFNYGSLPIYILKLVGWKMGLIDPSYEGFPNILLVGRALSALFDTITVFIVYKIGTALRDSRLGLLSALLYALAVFPIQNAHFYIVDPQMNLWILITLFFGIKAVKSPSPAFYLMMGITSGLAAATKFTGILALTIPMLAMLITGILEIKKEGFRFETLARFGLYGVIALVPAVLVFFLTQPYVALEFSAYWEQVSAQLLMNQDPTVFPYTIQFINTPAYLHPLKGIFIWGLGIPVGIICFLGLGLFIKSIFKDKDPGKLIVIFFAILFFAILGRSAVKFMRYYLPLYPILSITGGYLLYEIYCFINAKKTQRYVYSILVLISITIWPFAFIHIYSTPNTRIEATEWINTNLMPGSKITTEHWDDIVPLRNEGDFIIDQIGVYEPESAIKWDKINHTLDNSDYFIISSERVYQSILNWPEHYPYTTQFYKALFAGETDYQLIKTFTSYPRIGFLDIEIPDDDSPESMTIFDHPAVFVFERKVL